MIAVATLGGMVLNFTAIDPIKALFWAAMVNGVLAAPLMIVVTLTPTNGRIVGQLTLLSPLRVGGWVVTMVMALATAALFIV